MATAGVTKPARHEIVQDGLLRIFDAALASVIFIAPLFMGGRHPFGELAYVSLVCLTVCLWCLRQALSRQGRWRMSGMEFLLLGALAVLVLQLIQWPLHSLSTIAPLGSELLPLWGDGAVRIGEWTTISFTPAATRGQLVILIAHVMLFLVVVQRIESTEDVQRLLRWMALAVIGMATLALLQLFAGNGKFLWIYEHPSRTTAQAAKGAFANENHLASFLALGLGPIIAWITGFGRDSTVATVKAENRSRRQGTWNRSGPLGDAQFQWQHLALLIGLGVVAFAGLLTFSRGGLLVLAFASAVTTILLVWSGVLGRRAMGGLGVAMLIVVGALFIFGYKKLATEIDTLSSGSLEELDKNATRTKLWAADMQAVSLSPVLGTGAGSHAEIYQAYLNDSSAGEFTHAESSYVHLLLETGAAGLLVALAMLGISLTWAVLAYRRGGRGAAGTCAAVVFAGLIASAFHSIADFVWFIPACMSLAIILAACACRLWQLSRPAPAVDKGFSLCGDFSLSGFSGAIASILIVGLSVLMVANRTGPALASSDWERFLALRRAEAELDEEVDAEVLMQPLAATLANDPDHHRAHARLAGMCLRHFDRQQQQSEIPMPLSQIRDAAQASGFADRAQQDAWVNRITGENRRWLDMALYHIHRALVLCPLQGDAYALLAEVAFLQGPQAPPTANLLQQALIVRPYDSHVLFAAGREAALAGDEKQAIALWRSAYHGETLYRRQIVALIAPRLPADEFVKHFEPRPSQLPELFSFYRDANIPESAARVAQLLVANVEQEATAAVGNEAAAHWNRAFTYYQFLDDKPQALACIANAAKADPMNYDYHRLLAGQLLKNDRYDEAIVEIRWCRQRRTADPRVEQLWAIARRGPKVDEADLR